MNTHYSTCYWSESGQKERQIEHLYTTSNSSIARIQYTAIGNFCITCERIDVEIVKERERIADNLYLVINNPHDAAPLALWIREGARDGFTIRD